MKPNKIYRNALVAMAVAGVSVFTACSDWDDHYDTFTSDATKTAWQNIQDDPMLSDFASLVQKAGYDGLLNGSQTVTVFAPVNGTFNKDSIDTLSNARLVSEFVLNHIARNNYPASGAVNENIFLINKKMKEFQGVDAASYTFGGIQVMRANQACSNGVIHELSGSLDYSANIYESLNPNRINDIDSFCAYYHKYDSRRLDQSSSVIGPIVDGRQTYLDSVFYESNSLFYLGLINREDSNYTMVVPTNKAMEGYKAMAAKYYNYYTGRSIAFNARTDEAKDTTYMYDVDYLRDSLITRTVTNGLIFNNNSYGLRGNRALRNFTGGTLDCDSIVSTQYTYNHLYKDDANELFRDGQYHKMSNGALWTVDSLRIRPWNSFAKVIRIEGESGNCVVSSEFTKSTNRVYSWERNTNVPGSLSGSAYVSVSSSDANPEAFFYLPNVLSTTYNIYAVFVPMNIADSTIADSTCLPSNVRVQLYYNQANGQLARRAQNFGTINNNGHVIDTVKVGEFTFPICYEGLSGAYPVLQMTSQVSPRDNGTRYDRTLRIDCILLVPKELDDYKAAHPDYKYYDGTFF